MKSLSKREKNMEELKLASMSTGQDSPKRRERGEGRLWRRGNVWWIQYWANGQQVRESSHSDLKEKARRLLRRRLGEAAAGIAPPPSTARLTYDLMRDALLADYETNRRKWLRHGKEGKPYIIGISHLDKSFGGWRAANITTDAIRGFIKTRQDAGAANGTINRELSLLRRMFRLAIADGKLRVSPHFPMLKEAAPRKGFLEHGEYQKLRAELPEHLRPVLAVGYHTGMRIAEIIGLRWSNVDFAAGEIRLDAGTTKNGEARNVPLATEALEMVRGERKRNPDAEFVFVCEGNRVKTFYKAWHSATKRAGLDGLLFHDLRRTGIRNLVRAGVPERVAMAISGHRTRAVFERYNIVSGRDLKEAAAKLDAYLTGQNGEDSGMPDGQFGDNSGTICTTSGAAENGAIEQDARIQ